MERHTLELLLAHRQLHADSGAHAKPTPHGLDDCGSDSELQRARPAGTHSRLGKGAVRPLRLRRRLPLQGHTLSKREVRGAFVAVVGAEQAQASTSQANHGAHAGPLATPRVLFLRPVAPALLLLLVLAVPGPVPPAFPVPLVLSAAAPLAPSMMTPVSSAAAA